MTIENDYLKAVILEKGAELSSLSNCSSEYIWQADPSYWSRHSPVLFPIVGRLKDHEYFYNGKTYPMAQHGFARDSDFEVVKHTKNSISMLLRSNEATKNKYPFDFTLQLNYTLEKNTLRVGYLVKNESLAKPLYFSLGTHPAFNCPLERHHKRKDYALVFDKQESPTNKVNSEGLYIENRTDVFETPGVLPIHDAIFDEGSLTFNPNPFSKASLVHQPSRTNYFTMTFENYPYLGIWSPEGAPAFLCIEPWHGIADNFNHSKHFTEKEGIIMLEPKQEFSCKWSVEIH